jgi:hypothetical protein
LKKGKGTVIAKLIGYFDKSSGIPVLKALVLFVELCLRKIFTEQIME